MRELRTQSNTLAGKYGFQKGYLILEIRFKKDRAVRIKVGREGITAEDI